MTSKAFGLAQLGNAYSDGALSSRNLIINGAMQVAQRGTSFSVDGSFVKTLDRYTVADGSAGSFSVEQSTDVPSNFKNSLKITVSSADTSIAAGDYAWLQYVVEGYDCAHLNLGQADAQTFTLSFWIKSSVSGTFSGGFENYDGGRGYAFVYDINSTNTWEYKTVTVSGDTGGGNWKTDNVAGLFIYWDLGTGTDRTVATSGSWSASRSIGTASATKLVSTNGATFYITGVQLEVGDTATPFEHRSYGQELALCMRYYRQMEIRVGCLPWAGTGGGFGGESTQLNPNMRAAPSVTQLSTPTYSSTVGSLPNAVSGSLSSVNVNHATTASRVLIQNNASGNVIFSVLTNNAYDAEL